MQASPIEDMEYSVFQIKSPEHHVGASEEMLLSRQPSDVPFCVKVGTVTAGSLEEAWEIARNEHEQPLAVE
jgi:hypothetical protein